MIKNFLVAGFLFLLISNSLASGGSEDKASAKSTFPAEIIFHASVGEVTFPHQLHIKEFGVKCVECHHQINANKLITPHPDYLQSSWINCITCHSESGKEQQVYACSKCHRSNPKNIADETLSAKVVIHKSCGKCHPAGAGKGASMSCGKCHVRKKSS